MVNVKESKLVVGAIKTMANAARGVAKLDVNAASWMVVNQPKTPANMANRLSNMK